jgi:hypothetical protein
MPDEPFPFDEHLDSRLRAAMHVAAPDVSVSGVLTDVERRARRRQLRVRESIAAGVVVLLGALGVAGYTLTAEPHLAANGPAIRSKPAPATTSTVPVGSPYAQSSGLSAGTDSNRPAPNPPPCPAQQATPSTASGRFCGPEPGPGNGSGPDGTCTGSETAPPCGPGVTPGQYYTYTMPGTCSGLVTFDGKQWVSELPPPSPTADFFVWMRLDPTGSAGWISPSGTVGLAPYAGQTLSGCHQ